MSGRNDGGDRGPRRPANAGRRGGRPGHGPGNGHGHGHGHGHNPAQGAGHGAPAARPGQRTGPRRTGGLSLRRVNGDEFELVHPRCVREMELDFEEGIELRRAGDTEAARDALRYALQGCGDNLWVHVALGRIALDDFKDPSLARGHFGYAFELAQRALPPGFAGRLAPERLANRPFFDAVEGLSACYEALGKPTEAASLRKLAARLAAGRPGRTNPGRPTDPGPRAGGG